MLLLLVRGFWLLVDRLFWLLIPGFGFADSGAI